MLSVWSRLIAGQLASRILVSFILYSLYAPHPIAVNPFKSALFVTYVNEREKAVNLANEGGVSPNETLVWVLWKILKGDGNDVSYDLALVVDISDDPYGPFSDRSLLPQHAGPVTFTR